MEFCVHHASGVIRTLIPPLQVYSRVTVQGDDSTSRGEGVELMPSPGTSSASGAARPEPGLNKKNLTCIRWRL